MAIWRGAGVLYLLLAATSLAMGDDDLTGSIVFARAPKMPVKIGTTIVGEFSFEAKVLKQDGAWLEVRHFGKPHPKFGTRGYVERKNVVSSAEAVEYFTKRIKQSPNDAWALQQRGRAWAEKGESQIAISDLNEAIRLDPKIPYCFDERATLLRELRKYAESFVDFDAAIRLDRKDGFAYRGRGHVYRDLREFNMAIADYNEAIRLDHSDALAYRGRGHVYRERGEYDKALADYNKAIDLDRTVPSNWAIRGMMNAELLKTDEAFSDVEEALRLDANDAGALFAKAMLLAAVPDDARRNADKAINLAELAHRTEKEKHAFGWSVLAAAWAEKGDFAKAIGFQQKAIDMATPCERARWEPRLKLFSENQPLRFPLAPPK